MKYFVRILSLVVLTAFALLTTSTSRAVILFQTPSGASVSGAGMDAQASFTLSHNLVTVQLSNLQADPATLGQLLSGLSFDVSGASGSHSLASLDRGVIGKVSAHGKYSQGSSDSLFHWTATEDDGTVDLTSSMSRSGQLQDLIAGPDSQNDISSLIRDDLGGSFTSQQSMVLGSATFVIRIKGITSASQISNVRFQFGAGPLTTITGTSSLVAAPEPSTVSLFLLPLGLLALRQFRQR